MASGRDDKDAGGAGIGESGRKPCSSSPGISGSKSRSLPVVDFFSGTESTDIFDLTDEAAALLFSELIVVEDFMVDPDVDLAATGFLVTLVVAVVEVLMLLVLREGALVAADNRLDARVPGILAMLISPFAEAESGKTGIFPLAEEVTEPRTL